MTGTDFEETWRVVESLELDGREQGQSDGFWTIHFRISEDVTTLVEFRFTASKGQFVDVRIT